MQIHLLDTGLFKLDGGAMHGVVPRSLWEKSNPPDENNLCTWSLRCLLLQTGDRLILVDNGLGDKQDAKFFGHYYRHGESSLLGSLRKAGFKPADVTDMVLTHLHFDHCGGGVQHNATRTGYELTFPRARYWTNTEHWQWATQPNPREKASFLTENILPMQESGHLHWVERNGTSPFSAMEFLFVDGHTGAMMLPKVQYEGRTLLYVADLVPSAAHVPLPWVMGYDTRPLLTMEEKARILSQAAAENWILVFEHDAQHEAATVVQTDKGVRIDAKGTLAEVMDR